MVSVVLTGLADREIGEGPARQLAEAVGRVLGVAPAEVVVRGPGPLGPESGGSRPAELVQTFLRTVEARDLDRARALLADGFSMTFPGDRRFARLDELIEWARQRYRFARKTYERFDEAPDVEDVAVYCYGTLAGEWLDGTPFSGIRFVDRFTVRKGKLVDQRVWNDLAEVHGRSTDPFTPTSARLDG